MKDSGPGIAPELLAQIFTPFFSTKAPGKGTGMGLSVVNDIVHKHGGHIVLDTVPGAGASFRLLFNPVSEQQAAIGTEPSAKPRVLLVDDDVSVAYFLKELLDVNGYQVTLLNDSKQALAMLLEHGDAYQAMIADQSLPGLSGEQLAAAIIDNGITLPVLLCSTLIAPKEIPRGVTKVLTKPLSTELLLNALGELLPIAKAGVNNVQRVH